MFEYFDSRDCLGFLSSTTDVLTLAKDMGDEPNDQWLFMLNGQNCLIGRSLYQEKPHYGTLDSEVLSLGFIQILTNG